MRILIGRLAAFATISFLVACGGGGDGGTGNGGSDDVLMAANGSTSFAGTAGVALAGERPSVKVTDAATGAPKPGVSVSFAVTAGGGSLSGASQTTNAEGIATVGGWTLGNVAGANSVRAQVSGGNAVVQNFTATGAAGAAARLAWASQPPAEATPNANVGTVVVNVTDQFGNLVAGATNAVTMGLGSNPGSSTLGGTTTVAAVGGRATFTNLTVSNEGVNYTLSPSSPGLTGVPSGFFRVSTFNIDVRFIGPMPDAAVVSAFTNAAARWARVLADVPNVQLGASGLPANECTEGQPAVQNTTIDDVIIWASIDSIDGPSKTLGQAGPCYVRPNTLLVVGGAMVFDSADVRTMVNNGTLGDVIVHEMGHVIGIGSTWSASLSRTMTSATDTLWIRTTDVRYTGANGNTEYFAFGSAATGSGAPIENCTGFTTTQCGVGNWLGHWREAAFNNELMTGFVEASNNLLSRMSIGALKDLGYPIIMSGSDTYNLPTIALFSGPAPKEYPINDAPLGKPLREIHPDGSINVVRSMAR